MSQGLTRRGSRTFDEDDNPFAIGEQYDLYDQLLKHNESDFEEILNSASKSKSKAETLFFKGGKLSNDNLEAEKANFFPDSFKNMLKKYNLSFAVQSLFMLLLLFIFYGSGNIFTTITTKRIPANIANNIFKVD